jgi:hypothetical protein
MSVMIVSTVGKFPSIMSRLKEPGINSIHFFNSTDQQGLACPVLSLLPFVSLIVCDSASFGSPRLEVLRREAEKMNIPCIDENAVGKGGNLTCDLKDREN